MAKGGNTGKVPRPMVLGKTSEFDETGDLRGAHPNSTDMDDDGDNSLGRRGLQRYRLSGGRI